MLRTCSRIRRSLKGFLGAFEPRLAAGIEEVQRSNGPALFVTRSNIDNDASHCVPGSRLYHSATAVGISGLDTCLPASTAVSTATEHGYGPVVATIDAISSLQATTGLPWWATLMGVAAGVRVLLMPLTIQQLRSTAANVPLIRQAVHKSVEAQQPGISRAQRFAAEFRRLRAQLGAPSPAWIVAAPLVQLPVFVTAVLAVRRMAGQQWPGLDSGGLAWFADLTASALVLEPISAPMGSVGIVLPATVAGLLLANLNQAFSPAQPGPPARGLALAMSFLRLGLEWLALPVFLISMQLPQAVLVYWATSSATALAQTRLLRSSKVRGWMGLLPRSAPQASQQQSVAQPAEQRAALTGGQVEAALQGIGDDVPALFQQAAQWRADGNLEAAKRALERILELEAGNARAWFALGQTLAAMQQWRLAENAYTEAAHRERDPFLLSRAWLGAGVAATRDGDPDSGLQALEKAAALAIPAIQKLKDGPGTPPQGVQPAEALLFVSGKLFRTSQWAWEVQQRAQMAAAREVAVHALLSQGSVLQQQGRVQEAKDVVGKAAGLDPRASVMLAALQAESKQSRA